MLKKEEIIKILKTDSADVLKEADRIRQEYVGEEVHLRGLIEFSNICKRQCKYCGLQSTNKTLVRYRIEKDELLKYAKKAVAIGYKTIVLQSGEDDFYTCDYMCEIISEIKKMPVALTLSMGEKSFEEYKAYKEAGADRYLIRIETTDKALYEKIHPKASFENRKRCLEDLKKLGYEVGTGCLVGLRGQTIESLADDILFFKTINADMVGIGPFIPHPQTELKDDKVGSFDLALKVMALTRIMLKDINIPATTAMETLSLNGRVRALQSGANVVMLNVTSQEYCEKYQLYPNKTVILDDPEKNRKQIEAKIRSIGRTISANQGFRKNL